MHLNWERNHERDNESIRVHHLFAKRPIIQCGYSIANMGYMTRCEPER